MRWVKFSDGTKYTFAVDIQKFAECNGYSVPCDKDGTRHPGTDCNAKMHTIMKDAGMRKTFHVNELSVVDVKMQDPPANSVFIDWLAGHGVVNGAHCRLRCVQLYSKEAVNALLSMMLKTHVEYHLDGSDVVWNCPVLATRKGHNFEKKRNKPKASLFNK